MAMNRWARLGLALPAFALAPSLSHSLASPFPVGSYDSDAYTLTFDTTGTFHYMKSDQLMVEGNMSSTTAPFRSPTRKGSMRVSGLNGTPARIAGN